MANKPTLDEMRLALSKVMPKRQREANAKGGSMMGINVASDRKAGRSYADMIVDGHKTIESRNSDTLRPYVGKRVAIVRTGEGKAKAIGEVTIGEPIVANKKQFRNMESHHLVPEGSTFDIKTETKHMYPLSDPVRYDKEHDVGHGILSRKVIHKANGGVVHMGNGGKPNDAAFIGYLSPHGKFESYPESVAKANDYHHSYTIKDLDAYNAEGGLTFVRMNSDPEITIKGTPAMDPFHHKNSPMVSDLARRIIKSGGHHDMPIKVEHMGFEKHEAPYQGKYIGTLRQWSMRNAEKKAKGGSVEPKNTVKAYKLFRVHEKHPGKLFPLFVDANTPVEMNKWVNAKEGEMANGKVKSKIGALAFRPGWHAGDVPVATHIGEKSDSSLTAPDTRPDNHAWAEVEMPNDKDWQSEANKRGTNAQGKVIPVKAHITDQIPKGGHYRYKTNPNMTGNWLIGGSMKVNKILTDAEVAKINKAHGVEDLPRAQKFNKKKFGFARGGVVAPQEWVAEEHVNHGIPKHIQPQFNALREEFAHKAMLDKSYQKHIAKMPFKDIPTMQEWIRQQKEKGGVTHAHHLEIEERPL